MLAASTIFATPPSANAIVAGYSDSTCGNRCAAGWSCVASEIGGSNYVCQPPGGCIPGAVEDWVCPNPPPPPSYWWWHWWNPPPPPPPPPADYWASLWQWLISLLQYLWHYSLPQPPTPPPPPSPIGICVLDCALGYHPVYLTAGSCNGATCVPNAPPPPAPPSPPAPPPPVVDDGCHGQCAPGSACVQVNAASWICVAPPPPPPPPPSPPPPAPPPPPPTPDQACKSACQGLVDVSVSTATQTGFCLAQGASFTCGQAGGLIFAGPDGVNSPCGSDSCCCMSAPPPPPPPPPPPTADQACATICQSLPQHWGTGVCLPTEDSFACGQAKGSVIGSSACSAGGDVCCCVTDDGTHDPPAPPPPPPPPAASGDGPNNQESH